MNSAKALGSIFLLSARVLSASGVRAAEKVAADPKHQHQFARSTPDASAPADMTRPVVDKEGRWGIMIFRFAVNPETKKPDPATFENKTLEIDYEGGVHFPEPYKEDQEFVRSLPQDNPKKIGKRNNPL